MAVLGLDVVGADSLESAGGKGANLGELIRQGFPVPPGFVIGADEYARFIEVLDLPANDDIPEDTESFLNDLRGQLLDTAFSEDLLSAIDQQLARVAESHPGAVFAVRSSATAEDLADASFAGQHDTYYYVEPDQVSLMIRKCWASLWSESAFSYRHTQGIEHRTVNMAVVVQVMVRSEVSGVTFTADPVSGSDSVIITESSWGMGAAIVDGRVTPDQFLVDKGSMRLTSLKISDKKFMVPPVLEDKSSSRLQEVPATQRRLESLTDDQVEEIAALAMKAEEYFGKPQDLEWAIENEQIYLLQSRPITIMGEADEDIPEGRWILFKPVIENFTDPLMPLTEDILAKAVPFMKVIYGRVYMNFDHFRGLVPLKVSDDDLARLAYLSDPKEANIRVSIPKIIALMFVLFGNYLMMGVFNRRTANMPDDFMSSYRAYMNRVVEDDSINAPNTMIHMFLRFRFFEPAGNMVMLANLVAPRYMIFLRMLQNMITRWAPEMHSDTASLLCSGSEGVLSTEMGRSIVDLARTARKEDKVRDLFNAHTADKVLAALQGCPEAAEFLSELDAFLNMHGHRALKEFELASVRWDEDPTPVLGMVRNYLVVDQELDDTESDVEKQREELMEELGTHLDKLPLEGLGKPRRAIIKSLVEQTKYYMKLRENSRFYHIMGFYGVRKKILAIETRLLEEKILKCKDDIFYLHWEEVDQLNKGELGWLDVEDTIRARRMEHIRRTKMVPPRTIGVDIDAPTQQGSGEMLSGQAASPGQYEGIARVILDPATDNEIEPGEILVAPYTDPAWTPLFLTANAAVVEVGSYLSHAGTIAREYGMPCVVDATGCTSRITTGTRIMVDGSNGEVTILSLESEGAAA